MITPANALKFSAWLAATHPQAFQAVLQRVVPVTTHRNRVALGAAPTVLPRSGLPPRSGRRAAMRAAASRAKFGQFGNVPLQAARPPRSGRGGFGDVLEEFTPTVQPMTDFSDPTLTEINVDIPDTGGFDLSSSLTDTPDSGGFWSSIGSGLSSIGGGLSTAVGAVAHAITNPQVLQAAGSVAATVIAANSSQHQAQQQQALLQAQLQRVGSGSAPAPVRYYTDPQTGASVPYYYNAATGQYQPTQANLLSAGPLSQYLPYILIGGGVIVLALIFKR